ncbi:flotillin family protein [Thalassospira xianhensis]|uniref:flotillin family protein n=1 Tax=Thalassospira xianhensis TaxID=478503 RepID=UPI000DED8F46|nr:flotillin domain-containing protein [Thalassospira xianhensis]
MIDILIYVAAFLVIAAVTLGTIGFVFARLYKRSTKEQAFVRTGLGGEKVILDGGAVVLPVFHAMTPVSLKTRKLIVNRDKSNALITADSMRADVSVEFYVRVKADKESILVAATTLGQATNDVGAIQALVEGKFVDALRSVASTMNLEELHRKREQFVQNVQNTLSKELGKNGLELEGASLIQLDQTDEQYLNEGNSFDAAGLKKLREITEGKRQERNNIERTTEVAIKRQDVDAKKSTLDMQLEAEIAEAAQEREVENTRALQRAEIAARKAETDQSARQAEIKSGQAIKIAEIEAQENLALKQQRTDASVANASKEVSLSRKEAAEAEASAVKATEAIETARTVEVAEREKAVNLVKAEEQAQAALIQARAEADAENVRTDAMMRRFQAEADGKRALIEAENVMSEGVRQLHIIRSLHAALPEIIAQSVKPMEKIDSINIAQIGGLDGLVGGGNVGQGVSNASSGSLPEQIVNSALRFQACNPLLSKLLAQAGISSMSAQGLSETLGANITGEAYDAVVEKAKEAASSLEAEASNDDSSVTDAVMTEDNTTAA